ncbi:hypothetical protein MY3296_006777 [Beauveria thailandica]
MPSTHSRQKKYLVPSYNNKSPLLFKEKVNIKILSLKGGRLLG